MAKFKFKSIKMLSIVLAIFTLISTASLMCNAATTGTTDTRTITVVTKANYWVPGASSITLKQSKGKFTYTTTSWTGKKKYHTGYCYGYYRVTADPVKGKGHKKTATFSGSSKKITLDPNTTYKITVAYDSMGTWLNSGCKLGEWNYTPKWRVSSTWKVDSYW